MLNSIGHRIAALIALALIAASGADAAQRTFVSTSGIDNPACSLIAPCRNFAAAITATSIDGEIVVLNSGGYGSVTVNKNVSIISPPGVYGGVAVFSGDGITVDDGGSNTIVVVLRGLTINGQGGTNGVRVVHANAVHVEACNLSNLTQNGIFQTSGTMYVKDTIARNNGNVGAYILGAGVVANFDRVRMEANLNGVYVQDGAHAFIQDSVLSGNGVYGVVSFTSVGALASSSTGVSVTRTLITNNSFAGAAAESDLASTPALIDISDSDISGNFRGIWATNLSAGPTRIVAARNTIVRNYNTGVESSSGGLSQILVTLDGNVLSQNTNYDVLAPVGTIVSTRANNTGGGAGIFTSVSAPTF